MHSFSPGDLLLDSFSVGLCKQVKHGAAEVVGMTVGVSQLIGNCIQEEVPTCRGEVVSTYGDPCSRCERERETNSIA